jgi:methylglyoxal synthase
MSRYETIPSTVGGTESPVVVRDITVNIVIEHLRSSEIADHFCESELAMIAGYMNTRPFTAGDFLVRKSDPASFVGMIIEGSAHVIVNELKVETVTAGTSFGEAMFSSDGIRTADLQAAENGRVAELSSEAFEQMLADNRNLALRTNGYFEQVYCATRTKDEKHFARDKKRYLALIAHNEMKPALLEFVSVYKDRLNKYPLVATGTTGARLYRETGVALSCKVKSGPLGGDQAIGAMISTENILGVIFFRDPLSPHPHHADIEALGRLSDVYHVPFATNPATAEAVLDYLDRDRDRNHAYFRNPALERYSANQAKVANGAISQSNIENSVMT